METFRQYLAIKQNSQELKYLLITTKLLFYLQCSGNIRTHPVYLYYNRKNAIIFNNSILDYI